MPELPEVETTRRCLEAELAGAAVVSSEVRRSRMLRRQPRPADFADRLAGSTVTGFGRHGKFLVAELDRDLSWVTHLGMSGRIAVARAGAPEAPHTNVVVRFAGGRELRFVDPRTFGFMAVLADDELGSVLGGLGPDALTDLPRSAALELALARRSAPIKALLLDQRIVAGLGNIYADEALHRARIDPRRPGGTLAGAEIGRLRTAIRTTLAAGLRWGGTSLDDLAYLLPDGTAGEYKARLRVYGREDRPCRVCGTPIRRVMLRQRSTHWCPRCQT
ncbi:MAG TPA: bifunctional DNA-formamidopyrimidine glycosylase/DNA-(apurinic or apyrimidinic site) lyase [Acidimicrobiia bacterium]|jgi:formamidopyrimidine-DNA glycosylase